MSEDGGPTFASNEYVVVKMTSRRSGSDPRWQVAKLNCTQISMRMLGLFSSVTPKTEPAALELTRSSFSHGVREPIQRKKRWAWMHPRVGNLGRIPVQWSDFWHQALSYWNTASCLIKSKLLSGQNSWNSTGEDFRRKPESLSLCQVDANSSRERK